MLFEDENVSRPKLPKGWVWRDLAGKKGFSETEPFESFPGYAIFDLDEYDEIHNIKKRPSISKVKKWKDKEPSYSAFCQVTYDGKVISEGEVSPEVLSACIQDRNQRLITLKARCEKDLNEIKKLQERDLEDS